MNQELANYACYSSKSRGRLHKEALKKGRSEFARDRDRIIHSTAFRRLEYKTQVFINNEGDHYRTRLTHSLEVAQLARSLAKILRLDEELSEVTALAHDLGHAPFGHAGEDALQEAMENFGGFDHNAQTIRILTKLEKKYIDFDGLNLTWECLEGLAKHNGPVKKPARALLEFNKIWNLELNSFASLEAQIAAISDDIAYNSHDIEDGLRASLFTFEEVFALPVIGDLFKETKKQIKTKNSFTNQILVNEVRSAFIKHMLDDVTSQTLKNIEKYKIRNVDDVRNSKLQLANFSSDFNEKLKIIRAFLKNKMYHHYKVQIMTRKAKRVVKDLFNFYFENPNCLAPNWLENINIKNEKELAVNIADFIAGMTDRYAFIQHNKIFNVQYTNL
ncbi:MAG: deoxyguanosinetriphosphate triphosphohydrolase [Rickettsiales bacterium]|nr:deoxyguanosinetriphosphate triphosphohydrolase [Rickettsiales bacterium]